MSNNFIEIVFDTVGRAVRSPAVVGSVTTVAGVTAGYALAPEKEIIKETVHGKHGEVIKEITIEMPSPDLLAREERGKKEAEENLRVKKELEAIDREWQRLIDQKLKASSSESKHRRCMWEQIDHEELKGVPSYKKKGWYQNRPSYDDCIKRIEAFDKERSEDRERAEAELKADIRKGWTTWEPKLPSRRK